MRFSDSLTFSSLFAVSTTAFRLPEWQSFLPALSDTIQDYLAVNTSTSALEEGHSFLRRQNSNGCPRNFNSCSNLGAPGLCCAPQAICTPDAVGHVACCPTGYVCSGTIAGVITAGTVNSQGSLIGTAGVAGGGIVVTTTATTGYLTASTTGIYTTTTTANNGNGFVQTGGGGFIVDGGTTVATPGAGAHAAQVPWVARAIIRVIEFLPL